MGFDFAAAKATSRQIVHDYLAVEAVYEDYEIEPETITVRWHNKLARAGALEGGFDVEVLTGVDRLVFNRPEITSKQIVLRHGGYVRIPQYGIRYSLEAEEPADGPVNIYWSVSVITEEQSAIPPDPNVYIATEEGAFLGDEEGRPITTQESISI